MNYQSQMTLISDLKQAFTLGRKVIYRKGSIQFTATDIKANHLSVIPESNCEIVSITGKGVYKSSVDTFCVALNDLSRDGFYFTAA